MHIYVVFHVIFNFISSDVFQWPSWSWSYGSWIRTTYVQSVPITTNVVSLNPIHGEVYSIQNCVIKFVSDLRQIGGFLQVLRFPPPIKLTAMIITEILLRKLNTEPSIGASHQVSVQLAKQFQRRRFLEINQSETRIAYGSHVC